MEFIVAVLNFILICYYKLKWFFYPKYYRHRRPLPVFYSFDNESRKQKEKAVDEGNEMYVQWDGGQQMVVLATFGLAKAYYKQGVGSKAHNDFWGYAYSRLYGVMLGATDGSKWKIMKEPLNYFFSYQGVQDNMHVINEEIAHWLDRFKFRVAKNNIVPAHDLGINQTIRTLLGRLLYGNLDEQDLQLIDRVAQLNLDASVTTYDYTSRYHWFTSLYKTETVRLTDQLYHTWCIWNKKKLAEIPLNGDTVFARMAADEAYTNEDIFFQTMYEMLILNLDTSCHILAVLFYNLAQMPDLQERLLEELLAYSQHPIIGLKNISDLPLCRSVMYESARFQPAHDLSFPEELFNDWQIDGIMIPKGTKTIQDPYLINRDKAEFEDPNVFKPDRFVSPDDVKKTVKVYRFGFGSRKCLGNQYADMMIILAVDKLIRSYKMSVVEPKTITTEIDAFPVVNKTVIINNIRFFPRETP